MTREEAVNALKMMNLSGAHPFLSWEEMMEVRDMAISALRAQQEQTGKDIDVRTNAPLTLDELREMDGEPVWWWNTSAKPVCTICVWDRFMNEPMFANYDWQSEDALQLSKYRWIKKCGYKPYRHKPEEGTV